MRGTLLVGVVLVMAGVQGVAAQVPAGAEPGARVRATLPCDTDRPPARLFGVPSCSVGWTLVHPSADSVTLDEADARRTHDLSTLTALQLSPEEGSWARRGAVIGAVVGGIATYVLLHRGGSTSLCDRSANQDAIDKRECLGLTVVGGAAGAGLGALLGARFPRER